MSDAQTFSAKRDGETVATLRMELIPASPTMGYRADKAPKITVGVQDPDTGGWVWLHGTSRAFV